MSGQSTAERWASAFISPSPIAFVFALLIAISIPFLLHFFLYKPTSSNTFPSFLLVGPSGSGKTSLLTHFERGSSAVTHSSQVPLTVEVSLPVSTTTASSRYRSANDPSLQAHKTFLLVDTPGHGKLRYHAIDRISKPRNVKGILFVVDAACLSTESGLREAAEYLHDLLLLLQKRTTGASTSKAPSEIPLLIAVNKLDLFTGLPAPLVKSSLETEITKIRAARSKGLLDSGVGIGDVDNLEEKDLLGDVNAGSFEFSQMRDANVNIDVLGGNVIGNEGINVQDWWDWIGGQL